MAAPSVSPWPTSNGSAVRRISLGGTLARVSLDRRDTGDPRDRGRRRIRRLAGTMANAELNAFFRDDLDAARRHDRAALDMNDPRDLSRWTARPRPARKPLEGRYARLEPLDAKKHGDELFVASADRKRSASGAIPRKAPIRIAQASSPG